LPYGIKKHAARLCFIVTAIGDRAFADCPELDDVAIPESVTIIGYQAFDNGADVTLVLEGEREYMEPSLPG